MLCIAERARREILSLSTGSLCALLFIPPFFSILRVHTLCVRVMFIYLSFVRNLFFVLPSFSSVGRLIYRAAGRLFKNGDFTLCTFFSIFSAKMKRKKKSLQDRIAAYQQTKRAHWARFLVDSGI